MPISKFVKEKTAQFLLNSGVLRTFQRSLPGYLTVLNYHRIAQADDPNGYLFKPNISATPTEFSRQIDLIGRWFNVIALEDLVAFIEGKAKLPPYAALITFDDGYHDNYQNAYPILAAHQIRGLIFLTTGYITNDRLFFWDLVAYCFYKTQMDHVSVPELGNLSWSNPQELDQVVQRYVEVLKRIPDLNKQTIIEGLPNRLHVDINIDDFCHLMMNWDQIRFLSENGVDFGAHTVTHPILSRTDPQVAREEIISSKLRIEKEIGKPVVSFAYPNGQRNDFTPVVQSMVSDAGYQVAFTLISGPQSYNHVRQEPFAIRRIFLSHKDSLARFAIKVSGLGRLKKG